MKRLTLTIVALAAAACTAEPSTGEGTTTMEISRAAARPASPGAAETFTGSVNVTTLFEPNDNSQIGAALVAFEPGARTAWHTHPRGRRLVVTAGLGRTQVEGGPVEEIREGDVVWCPPGVRHWHGAGPTTAMSHIAIQESANGTPVTWMEQVTDEQYGHATR